MPIPVEDYAYDAKGNRVSRTAKAGGSVETYTYDSQNRLVGYAGAQVATYAYDALDRRIAKTVDGVVEAFVYDPWSATSTTANDAVLDFTNGTLTRRWLHGPQTDEPLAFETYTTSTTPGTGTARDLHADRLGNILRVVEPATGTVAAAYDYDSFGTRSQTGALDQRYGFTGREHDGESGLIYFRARHYDAGTGTFLQRDPIGFASGDLNLYAYVWNDPLNWTDPSGLAVTADYVMGGAGLTALGLMCYQGTICPTMEDSFSDGFNMDPGGESHIPAGLSPIGAIGYGIGLLTRNIFDALISAASRDDSDGPGGPGPGPGPGHNGPPRDAPPPLDPTGALLAAIAAIEGIIQSHDSDFTHFKVEGANGDINLGGKFSMEGTHLTINDAMVFGEGAGTSSISELRDIASRLGREMGAETVTINGYRVSGANPGRTVSITFRLN